MTCDNVLDLPSTAGKTGAGRINAYRALTDTPHPNYAIQDINFSNNEYLVTGEVFNLNLSLKNWGIPVSETTNIYVSINDPDVEVIQNNFYMPQIQHYETGNFINTLTITPTSDEPTTIDFDIVLSERNILNEEIYSEIFRINVDVRGNSITPDYDFGLDGTDNTITTDIVVDNMDSDSEEELAFVALKDHINKLHIYNNDSWTSSVILKTSAKPVISDIDDDGEKEIILAQSYGQVVIKDIGGNNLYSIQTTLNNVVNLSVEDLDNDNSMDIIISDDENSFAVIHNIDINNNLHDISYHEIDDSMEILTDIAVGKITESDYKDAVVFYRINDPDRLTVKPYVLTFDPDRSGNDIIVGEAGETLLDVSNFYDYKWSNIILAKPSINGVDYRRVYVEYKYRENVFIPDDDADLLYFKTRLVCYDLNYEIDQIIWSNDIYFDYSPIDIGIDDLKIICGDFIQSNNTVEILTQFNNQIIDIIDGTRIDYLYSIEVDQGLNDILYFTPEVLVDVNNDLVNDCFVSNRTSNAIYRIDENQNFIINSALFFNTAQEKIVDVIIAKSSNINSRLIVLTNLGKFYSIPYSNSYSIEWSQCLSNAKADGCYYQNIPNQITSEYNVYHDCIVSEDIYISPTGSLNIFKGNEIRFEKDKSIFNRGNLNSTGTSTANVYFKALCKFDNTSYWNGISNYDGSSSSFDYTKISNAETGVMIFDQGQHSISRSELRFNNQGVLVYNNSPVIRESIIRKSDTNGLRIHHSSTGAIYDCSIFDNDVAIELRNSYPLLSRSHNDIYNNSMNVILESQNYPIDAIDNWWGSDDIQVVESLFSDPSAIIFTPFSQSPNRDEDVNLLREAYDAFINNNYEMSQNICETIIDDEAYDSNKYEIISLIMSNLRFSGNQELMQSTLQTYQSELTEYDYNHLIALINRVNSNYSNAVSIYESIVDTAENLDYINFANIDIALTNLETNNRSIENDIETYKEFLNKFKNNDFSKDNQEIHIEYPNVKLNSNYPNPFNPTTTISFEIHNDEKVELDVFNVKGQKVKRLISEKLQAGNHSVIWNGKDESGNNVASGVYFYKISTNKSTISKKMLMLK